MPGHSFTSNFKRRALSPLGITLALVLISESWLGHFLSNERFYYHDIDRVMVDLQKNEIRQPYLLIGDSVLPSATAERALPPQFVNLGLNQAIEMVGEYFLVKRYLEKNPPPKAVIFVGLNPFGKNLEHPWTETYVKRVFLRYSEILDLLLTKRDYPLSLGMWVYRMFPTYRFRDSLKREYGLPQYAEGSANAQGAGGNSGFSVWKLAGRIFGKAAPEDLSKVYFERLLEYLQARNIDFYYLSAGESQENYENWKHTRGFKTNGTVFQSHEQLVEYLAEISRRHPNFHFDPEILTYPAGYFYNNGIGSVHFNSTGAPYYRDAVLRQLTRDLQIPSL